MKPMGLRESLTGATGVAYWGRGRRLLGPRASLTGAAGVSPAASAQAREASRGLNFGCQRHLAKCYLDTESCVLREASRAYALAAGETPAVPV